MANAKPNTEVDPKELEKAKSFYHGFTKLMTVSAIAVAIVLILMAIFLV